MYNTHNYQSGQVLTAGALNEMDRQILSNSEVVETMNTKLDTIANTTLITQGYSNDTLNNTWSIINQLNLIQNQLNNGGNTPSEPTTGGLEALFNELGYSVPNVLTQAAQRGIEIKNTYDPNSGYINLSSPTFLPIDIDLSNINYMDLQFALSWNGYDLPNYQNDTIQLSNAMGSVNLGNMGSMPRLYQFGPLVEYITFNQPVFSMNQYDGQSCLFNGCASLSSIEGLANVDITNHVSLSGAFGGTHNLFNLDGYQNWNTSNVTSMQGMFSGTAIQSLDLSNWDFQNVQNYCGIFGGTYNLHTLSLPSNFGVNAQQAQNAFQNCNLSTINIQGFNPDCGDISSMFQYCQNLNTVYLPEDFGRSSNELWGFFKNCWNLSNVYGSIDVGNVSPDSWVNALFPHQDWGNGQGQYNQIRYMVVKNIGKYEDGMQRSLEIYAPLWGMEDQSCVWDSLLNYSYDRKANGMSEMTINLHSKVGFGIGEEQYQALANKGYTLNYIYINDEAQ